MHAIDKNRPSPEWLMSLRRRFPTEKEIDRVLTRKMERRAGPGFIPPTLSDLINGIQSLLSASNVGPCEIHDARWLSGGASKLQVAFSLDWNRPGVGREATQMVLRMEPAESIVETSRLREFQLIKAIKDTVPVPPVFFCDALGEHLPYPALIYGFCPGVTKPSTAKSGVTGLGMVLPSELRGRLGPQFINHLAAIHRFDYRKADLSAFDVPATGTQCAEWSINWWERVWEEDCGEDVPLMRLCAAWLRAHLPVLDHPRIVHSDYRTGNFLFDEGDARISAWLDWELGRIGDPHQDIAWTTSRAFGHMSEDGADFLVCGLMPEQKFLDDYERVSGIKVDAKTVHWYKVFNDYMMVTLTLATGYRIAKNGKTHQDVLVAWLMGISGLLQEEMLQLLECTV